VYGLDLLNGTPIIDIKPYVAAFDAFPDAKAGWMEDITNQMDGRVNGYQQIKSSRGMFSHLIATLLAHAVTFYHYSLQVQGELDLEIEYNNLKKVIILIMKKQNCS